MLLRSHKTHPASVTSGNAMSMLHKLLKNDFDCTFAICKNVDDLKNSYSHIPFPLAGGISALYELPKINSCTQVS